MQLPKARVYGVPSLILLGCLAGLATAQSIYTCVDGKGRKITADRPIVECIDRPRVWSSVSSALR